MADIDYLLNFQRYRERLTEFTAMYAGIIDKYYLTVCRDKVSLGFSETSEIVETVEEYDVFYTTSDEYIMVVDADNDEVLSRYHTFTIRLIKEIEYNKIMQNADSKVILFEDKSNKVIIYTCINDDQTLNLVKG